MVIKSMHNPLDLTGKRILITGASSGIGRATAVLLSRLGATTVIQGRNEARLLETLRLLEPGDHQPLVLDLLETEEIAHIAGRICAPAHPLSGLVHSAGAFRIVPVTATTPALMHELLTLNCSSFVELVRRLVRKTTFLEGGSIVAISSAAALLAWPGGTAYSASKAAISQACKVMALEFAPRKIRVNSICPGMIRTPLVEREDVSDQTVDDYVARTQPLGWGTPEDVAHATAFLLSNAARFITGTNLVVDGGALVP